MENFSPHFCPQNMREESLWSSLGPLLKVPCTRCLLLSCHDWPEVALGLNLGHTQHRLWDWGLGSFGGSTLASPYDGLSLRDLNFPSAPRGLDLSGDSILLSLQCLQRQLERVLPPHWLMGLSSPETGIQGSDTSFVTAPGNHRSGKNSIFLVPIDFWIRFEQKSNSLIEFLCCKEFHPGQVRNKSLQLSISTVIVPLLLTTTNIQRTEGGEQRQSRWRTQEGWNIPLSAALVKAALGRVNRREANAALRLTSSAF